MKCGTPTHDPIARWLQLATTKARGVNIALQFPGDAGAEGNRDSLSPPWDQSEEYRARAVVFIPFSGRRHPLPLLQQFTTRFLQLAGNAFGERGKNLRQVNFDP
jgi:hypothetical protein